MGNLRNEIFAGLLILAFSAPVFGADSKDTVQNGDQAFQAHDYAAAFQLYQQAAKEGSAAAQNNLGYLYDHGLGVKQDYAQALGYYSSAAQAGIAAAQNNMGRLYAKGLGVAKNNREAFRWHSKAALQGDPEGEYWVGYDYALGRGVKRDMSLAAEWMKKLAQGGYAPAQAGLAHLYQEGLGVKKDVTQSEQWSKKAEAQKTPETQVAPGATNAYSYTVVAGDTLWSIARRLFASGHLFNLIFSANKGRIADPNLIHPGQVFTIPSSADKTPQKTS